MAWANNNNAYNNFDMDSADTPNQVDKRLCVRNHAAPGPDGTWRAEIKETGAGQQALRVVGKESLHGHMEVSATNLSSDEVPCGILKGIPGFQGARNRLLVNNELVTIDDDEQALDVFVGHPGTPTVQGSLVVVDGHQIGIGRLPDSTLPERIRMASPVVVPETVVGAHNARVAVDGAAEARKVDYPVTGEETRSLEIGADNATEIKLGFHSANRTVPTVVRGALTAQQPATLAGGIQGNLNVGSVAALSTVNLYGNVTVDQGSLTVGSELHATPASFRGPLTVTGGDVTVGSGTTVRNAIVHGQVRTNTIAPISPVTATTIQGKAIVTQSLTVQNSLGVSAGGASIVGKTEITNSEVTKSSLEVKHSSTTAAVPAMSVSHASTNANATGISVSAVKAITATGETTLSNTGARALTVNGEAKFTDDVSIEATLNVNSNSVVLGGSGATESIVKFANDRIEFWYGGSVKFYIDANGGHNT